MDYAAVLKRKIVSRAPRADGFSELVDQLSSYLPPNEIPGIVEAYLYAVDLHGEQRRLSGEAYINHPVAAAKILADLHLDASSIKAALLHDVIEDTSTTVDEVRLRFGDNVALLVDGVSKLDRLHFDSALDAQAASFRKMLLAMAKDLRVILVKLADRMHNMETLHAMPPDKRRRIARETLEIYAPIANRLGMHYLKTTLEELGFEAAYPMRHRVLSQQLRRISGGQRSVFKRIEAQLAKALKQHGIEARVLSRQKSLYSIYQKMKRKRVGLSEIVDLFGVRIVVSDVDQCYRVLGLVHQLYKPMPGRFKDYIAIPRVNGYQSLHTTLFGLKGVPLEIQIRTEEMDRVAERGIAANWQYKAVDKRTNAPEERARQWLAGLVAVEGTANSEEFLETVRVDLFPDSVYVFTPKGEIMRLPRGATTVDFAYAVHTDVGNRCVAAKINRRAVPLNTVLNNGDTVEILTERGASPRPSWSEHVVTAKARNAIRAHLRQLQSSEARQLGESLLSQALRPYSLTVRKLRKPNLDSVLAEFELPSLENLYERIGLGELLAPVVASHLVGAELAASDTTADTRKPLAVAGDSSTVTSYAGCCLPIPGDDIVGFMSKGRGIVIHRRECRNLGEFRNHPSKWIPVNWKSRPKGEFLTQIQVRTMDRVGLLAEVAGRISGMQSNIEFVRVDTDSDASVQTFRLKVRDRAHLAQLIRSIRQVPGVIRVARSTH
jgi:GTP diphosphokinase / guanosine-3',5'-bis(diphosphate) 3'-diphosphatase